LLPQAPQQETVTLMARFPLGSRYKEGPNIEGLAQA
jgi:hypothetical protein